ncbi:hypothetical protein, partial [Burkholderia cenocepacia]|uniref:hypothetical protein n=1 Tax=Burkholderia cenocepacia TaxID=95486 RepID=UPI00406D000B
AYVNRAAQAGGVARSVGRGALGPAAAWRARLARYLTQAEATRVRGRAARSLWIVASEWDDRVVDAQNAVRSVARHWHEGRKVGQGERWSVVRVVYVGMLELKGL